MSNDRVRVFKRVETDDEFVKRLVVICGYPVHRRGADLDDYAWTWFRVQRRIVEDER